MLTPGTVKNYLVSGDKERVSDQEVAMFINLCRFTGLNPGSVKRTALKYGNEPATLVGGKICRFCKAGRVQLKL